MKAIRDKIVRDFNEFRRTRYFHGMLLDDKDFRGEQEYHASKRRFLNRTLHGSGIVCGLTATWNEKTGKIEITPGLALDCCGNEIWVDHKLEIGVSQIWPVPHKTTDNGLCSEADNGEVKYYHLVICYEEKETDPVAVYLPGSSCDERVCEHSRIREGYRLELIEGKDCPEKSLKQTCQEPLDCPGCGHCDKSCCVTLGSLTLDQDGHIVPSEGPDPIYIRDDCRKYVIGGGVRQMILSVFTKDDPKNTSRKVIVVPGRDEPINDPDEALRALLGYLNDVQREIAEIKKALPPPTGSSTSSTIKKEISEEQQKGSEIKGQKPGKK
jgi:hypothetical protein